MFHLPPSSLSARNTRSCGVETGQSSCLVWWSISLVLRVRPVRAAAPDRRDRPASKETAAWTAPAARRSGHGARHGVLDGTRCQGRTQDFLKRGGGSKNCHITIATCRLQNINLTQAHYHAAGFLCSPTLRKALEYMLQRCKSRNLEEEALKI